MVLCGPEDFLRAEYTHLLADQLRERHGAVDVVRFDADAVAPADVLDELRSLGLLTAHKLVVVEPADAFVKAETRPMLERYAEHPAEGATLVLRGSRWNKGNLDKVIETVGVITRCDEAAPSVALAWAARRAEKRYEATLGRQAAGMLLDRTGTDLGRIDAELAKLALAAGRGGEIAPAHVTELVGRTREEEIWSIQAELLSGDPERTLEHLRLILDNAARDAHVPVTFACVDLARKLHGAAAGLESREPPAAIAKTLRLWGPGKDAILGVAKRLGPARTGPLLDACVDADVAQKTGLGRPGRTLERLAIRFADAVG